MALLWPHILTWFHHQIVHDVLRLHILLRVHILEEGIIFFSSPQAGSEPDESEQGAHAQANSPAAGENGKKERTSINNMGKKEVAEEVPVAGTETEAVEPVVAEKKSS